MKSSKATAAFNTWAVVYVAPDETLRMTGGLGPLQQFATAGSLTISLKEIAGNTTVDWTYAVGGYHPKGFQDFAPLVDSVLKLQLQRLKNYAESGKP